MKTYLDYETFKQLCLALAEEIKQKYDPEELVAISRGGISAAHIMAKHLQCQVGYFFPGKNDGEGELCLADDSHRHIVFVEDLIAQGRTYNTVKFFITKKNDAIRKSQGHIFRWSFVPILIDGSFDEKENNIEVYGLKSNIWIVFPYEEFSKMPEGDRGLFRESTDSYGS